MVRPDGSRGAFRSGDGALAVVEAAFLSRPTEAADDQRSPRDRIGRFSALAPYQDKLALGAWHYTASFPDIGPASDLGMPQHGSTGAYAVGELQLLGRDAETAPTLAGFMQLGAANSSTNRFQRYVGVGLVATGWVPGRSGDQIGVALANASNGSPYLQSQRAQGLPSTVAESTIELSYLTQLTKWLTLQPDLQYVMHPNSNAALRNAWVTQLRFELSF